MTEYPSRHDLWEENKALRRRVRHLESNVKDWKTLTFAAVVSAAAVLTMAAVALNAKAMEPAVAMEAALPAPAPHLAYEEPIQHPFVPTPEPQRPAPQLRFESATVTAYCICERCCGKKPDHPAYGITRSGRVAEPYVSVAVDPNCIPLGSTVYMDFGDGLMIECRADDTGSAVNGAHIDWCMPDHQTALQFGVRKADVYTENEWEVME